MREIFPPKPQESTDPGRVFYTIRPDDVNKRTINTEIGPIHVGEFIGRVLPHDVGKRIYRTPTADPSYWVWLMESAIQYERRMWKESE